MTNSPAPAIDLRSDTVTRPTAGMRAAIAAAPVGDDQYGEDEPMNALQRRVASLLGKEDALWLPSGTMANQVALRVLTHPGDDVIVSRESHAVWHETGGSGANAGVQLTEIGAAGVFSADQFAAAIKPRAHVVYPPTTLVEIENTHNRSGGRVFPQRDVEQICALARERGIASYLDGARLWNAAVASGTAVRELAAPFDLVSVALSKGLGCPGGTLLAGPRTLIASAVRHRRMLGGAMRQVGFYAAAGLYALDHHVDRLADDHRNARLFAQRLAECRGYRIDPQTVQTNIVVFEIADGGPDAAQVVARAREAGVLLWPFDRRTIRAVTHLDVDTTQCERAAQVLIDVLEKETSR
ncbi:MAG TPA: GntG family PLP-dependent aldolase [Burkholderiaceae bacterium]|nr:GntG family PLP-dependent aldolase [Burkholderiaceae bacterium]